MEIIKNILFIIKKKIDNHFTEEKSLPLQQAEQIVRVLRKDYSLNDQNDIVKLINISLHESRQKDLEHYQLEIKKIEESIVKLNQ